MSASRHTSTVVVLVRSARPRAVQREAIRTTWASRASGAVVFVLANISCGVPEAARASFGAHCAWAPGQRGIAVETSNLDALVRLESERHDDIVFADHVDTHRSSNAWLKQAYAWALEHTAARWLVKTDDDVYVHVPRLSRWLGALNDTWSIVGEIRPPGAISAAEAKTGETAEVRARWGSYAPWPRGSSGHALTRDLARFVARLPADAASFHGVRVRVRVWVRVRVRGRVRVSHDHHPNPR